MKTKGIRYIEKGKKDTLSISIFPHRYSYVRLRCEDKNECNRNPCTGGKCFNVPGSFRCVCPPGSKYDAKRKICKGGCKCLSGVNSRYRGKIFQYLRTRNYKKISFHLNTVYVENHYSIGIINNFKLMICEAGITLFFCKKKLFRDLKSSEEYLGAYLVDLKLPILSNIGFSEKFSHPPSFRERYGT